MSDVSELMGRCREALTMSKFLHRDHLLARANEDRALAADALETLAGEVNAKDGALEILSGARFALLDTIKVLEGRRTCAIEAFKFILSFEQMSFAECSVAEAVMERAREALATLEAAHD